MLGLISLFAMFLFADITVCICMGIFVKKSPAKKWCITLLISVPIMMITALFIGLTLLDHSPVKSTDLTGGNINGYRLYQTISQDEIDEKFIQDYESDDKIDYVVKDSHLVRISISKKTGEISDIYAYRMDETSDEKQIAPFMRDLQIGSCSFDDVSATYGENYRKIFFSEIAETAIDYVDRKNNILLHCYFTDNVLISVHWQAA